MSSTHDPGIMYLDYQMNQEVLRTTGPNLNSRLITKQLEILKDCDGVIEAQHDALRCINLLILVQDCLRITIIALIH